MMQISEQKLDEFISLYQKEFGIILDKKIAYDKALRLLGLIKIIYLPELINKNHEEHRTKI